ncbi:Glycosyltransferase like family protein [Flavobacterium succinicans]|uniref:Glycosyltransferase like family protein n=1 Tax=Flavobacterium succinicans TaxID=29536 RepID=A0A1I4SGD2_9FLAO|nr:glycosyltransferase [Flavobacterium succinicans]SFM63444.1 Glycosyltransferase like family protein [Flavobacterium succinicans]
MISLIICSRTTALSELLVQNIESTIGCNFEWIVIDNSENRYSIFEAYNLGIQKSKGKYLCFVHDDVLFHTQSWGQRIVSIFESDTSIGLLGIAGAKVKTKMPSAWWDCDSQYIRMHLKQHFKNGEVRDWTIGHQTAPLEEVVAIDGVFMMARKDNSIRFLESLTGFHNYDLNLSFEYLQKGYKIMVTNLIYIEHFSIGKLDAAWYASTLKIHNHYRSLLPRKVTISNDLKSLEFKNGARFLQGLWENRMFNKAIVFWMRLIVLKPISRFHFHFLKNIMS